MRIYLLVEEPESGYFADSSSYQILSVHRTEKAAKAAEQEWEQEHGFDEPHAFDGVDEDGNPYHWCRVCSSGTEIIEAELED